MTSHRASLPDITHHDVDIVLVSQWTVDTPERQQAVAEAAITAWERTPWPDGCISLACFVNTDGDTVLTYSQVCGEWPSLVLSRYDPRASPVRIDPLLPDWQALGHRHPLDAPQYHANILRERKDRACVPP